MCLVVDLPLDEIKMEKAEKDIVCYKVMLISDKGYQTPYTFHNVSRLCMWGLKKFRAEGKIGAYRKDKANTSSCIEGGVIHTFSRYHHARLCKKYAGEVIWECAIPKGTKYIRGTFDNKFPAFGSESIKFVKKMG